MDSKAESLHQPLRLEYDIRGKKLPNTIFKGNTMQITGLKIINRTSVALGAAAPYQTRTASKITHIAVHHSASTTGNTAAFEPTWRSYGWTNGGYTFVILRDGQVEFNYPFTVVTNGVANHNSYVLNVCVVGNGSFTSEQESALIILLNYLMKELSVPVKNVWGHNEFSGNATACPGRDMNALRNKIGAAPTVAPAQKTHKVVSGDTLYALSQRYGVTVAALQQVNQLGNSTLLKVGQVLTLPTSATTAKAPTPTLKVGGKVTVNTNATKWATGEAIPAWVRGSTYTVQQLRNNNQEVLLQDVLSWISVKDITIL